MGEVGRAQAGDTAEAATMPMATRSVLFKRGQPYHGR
jgi:hypothetical protein